MLLANLTLKEIKAISYLNVRISNGAKLDLKSNILYSKSLKGKLYQSNVYGYINTSGSLSLWSDRGYLYMSTSTGGREIRFEIDNNNIMTFSTNLDVTANIYLFFYDIQPSK